MAERAKRKHGLWWWVDRYRKSTAYTDMSLAEQGAYRNLLDEQRIRGGLLPNDERILAKVCGDALAWPEVREKVLARFEPTEDQKHLFNRTALEVNTETDRISTAAAVGGKARADHAQRDGGKFTSETASDSTSGDTSVPPASVVRSPYPLPLSVTGSENEVGETRARPANPLVDRDAMTSEGHRLIRGIAPLADLDPTEVLSKASRWRGNSYVRLDIIPDDRMAHTLEALRRWHRSLTGQSDPGPPPPTEVRAAPSPAAQAREDAANAMIRGGMRDRGKLGRGHEIAAGDDAGSRHDPGDDRAPRRALPEGSGTPDR